LATHLGDIRAALNWAFGPGGDLSLGVDLDELFELDLAEQSLVRRMPMNGRPGRQRLRQARTAGNRATACDLLGACDRGDLYGWPLRAGNGIWTKH